MDRPTHTRTWATRSSFLFTSDRFVGEHKFFTPDAKSQTLEAFFSTAGEAPHERIMERAADQPVVRNDVGDRIQLLASWGESDVNRTLTETRHTLRAYLQFTTPGEFNLAGRLAADDGKRAGGVVAIRVVSKDMPVVVLLEHFYFTDAPGDGMYQSSSNIAPGTLEVRVGDRVLIACGRYILRQRDEGEVSTRHAVARPFNDVKAYTADPQK